MYRVFIYGFKTKDGRMAYIGQTVTPKRREKQHRKNPKVKDELSECEFTILKTCNSKTASSVEHRMVKRCKRNGECWLNKSKAQANTVNLYCGVRVKFKDMEFKSWTALGRFLNISVPGLRNRIKKGWETRVSLA